MHRLPTDPNRAATSVTVSPSVSTASTAWHRCSTTLNSRMIGSVRDQPKSVSPISLNTVRPQPKPRCRGADVTRQICRPATSSMSRSQTVKNDPDSYNGFVGPVGLEPTTRGLKVRCSAS